MSNQYRKKPVVIEAFRLTKETRWSNDDWPNWMHYAWNRPSTDVGALIAVPMEDNVLVNTLEGVVRLSVGDWLICGVQGELYPCKPDIFDATYEKVEDRE